MKIESQLYDLHDRIMDDIRSMTRDDDKCCQFHVPGRSDLPKLCNRCRRKLVGLREYIADYEGKYLVIEHVESEQT